MDVFQIALNAFVAFCLFIVAWIFLNRQAKHINTYKLPNVEKEQLENKEKQLESDVSIPKNKCLVCGVEGKMKPCGRCRSVFYCGKACQLKHWKQEVNGHKQNCYKVQSNSDDLDSKKIENKTSNHPQKLDFGSTSSEREELASELDELSLEERKELLKAWEKLPSDQLSSPSKFELEKQLKDHKEEISSLLYQASYGDMDEKETKELVNRIKELKELIKLTEELLEYHVLESTLPKEPLNKNNKNDMFRCMPCSS